MNLKVISSVLLTALLLSVSTITAREVKDKGNKLVIDCTSGEQPATACVTEKEFDVDLWPNGLPNTNGIDRTPFDDNVQNYKPSLRVYLPPKEIATGRVVIACPGGAVLSGDHDGQIVHAFGLPYELIGKENLPQTGRPVFQ